MKRVLSWLALAGVASVAEAVDIPLEFRKFTLEETFASPGGYGVSSSMTAGSRFKPTREPSCVSQHPIYGRLTRRTGSVAPLQKPTLYRLDESRGDGKGYDRLIVDANGNEDLTDDAVVEKAGAREGTAGSRESAWFGPLVWPENIPGTSWKPVLYAEMNLYNRASLDRENEYLGSLRVRSGWVLEATVEVDGVKEKVAFQDADCNFRLADPPMVSKVFRNSDREGSWYLGPRDYVLRGPGKPGRAKGTPYATAEPWYQTVYFEGKPYTVTLKEGLTAARVEPLAGPMGSIAVDPKMGELQLARGLGDDRWEPITPQIREGKVTVGAGPYRLMGFKLAAKDSQGTEFQALCQQAPERVYTVAAGQTERLPYGLPMELKVTARKERGQGTGIMGAARSLFGGGPGKASSTLVMDLSISGPAREAYAGFYKIETGESALRQISPPSFRILDRDGKQVASGSFEFG